MHPLTKLLRGFPPIGVAAVAGLAVMAPSAKAVDPCSTLPYAGSIVFGTGFSCKVGDKTYGNFVDNTGGLLASNRYAVSILQQDDIFTLSIQGDFRPSISSNYSYGYRVAVDPDNSSYIQNYATGVTTANVFTVATKSLFTAPSGVPNPATTSFAIGSFPDFRPIITSTGLSSFPDPGLKIVDFTSTFFIGVGSATQLTDGIRQVTIGSQVPGPLPILGAAAAFGYSRRIRRRIKLAA